ncbi:nucleoside recognition protein [Pyrobaculum neutrophilum]|uniref:Nucleoside recognition domain protein n=1 Tax=Pyrobaculum neutrophilum (strain DSM 2338 / JCM 9278 / NBRC 100436 / V24Sta) TaxID=444157 RepID=B1YBT6_PYRNV|nr:nucleoside recognition protein [Pyrobaculum neutrophilum]ACB39320.1 nucleoside recognition domain protein [Pyrobaculum neutrophilum V24Sta]
MINPAALLREVLFLAPSVIGGSLLAAFLMERGVLNKLRPLAAPFVKLSGLGPEAAAAFITAFFDVRSANALLVTLHREGRLSRREMYLASLMNAFPAAVRHWDSMLPPLLALLGLWGALYFACFLLVGLAQTLLFALLSRLLVAGSGRVSAVVVGGGGGLNALKRALRRAVKILATSAAALAVVELAASLGLFGVLNSYVKSAMSAFPLSAEELGVAVASMVNYAAGAAAAAALINAGLLDGWRAVKAMLLGSAFSFVTALRAILPYYVGVFGPRDGPLLMAISTSVRTALILALVWI